jgi:hypothetical protein
MAKIRVQDKVNVDKPSREGYIFLVEKLVFGEHCEPNEDLYEDFIYADPDERVDILKDAATFFNSKGKALKKYYVTHLEWTRNANGDLEEKPVEIDSNRCRIVVETDRRKRGRVKRSKFTVALPDRRPKGNVDYLAKYAEIIHTIYKEAEELDAKKLAKEAKAKRSDAHKFMFGVMLLTRCR